MTETRIYTLSHGLVTGYEGPQVAEKPTFEALRLLWTVVYLGFRFLRADSQHNAATVEQARVETGYDEEVIFLNRTR